MRAKKATDAAEEHQRERLGERLAIPGKPLKDEEDAQLVTARRRAMVDKAVIRQLQQQGASSPGTRRLIERDSDDRPMAAEGIAREAG